MMTDSEPRIQKMALGGAACDTVVWRYRNELRVTVIVKATFAMVPDDRMRLTRTEPVRSGVEYHGSAPNRSVRATSERAPFLRRADVVLVGHACTPGSAPATTLPVRLAVLRDAPLLDKKILARGDRAGSDTFTRLPLAFELAYGGLGSPDNPLGKGFGTRQAPNLIDPDNPAAPACFAPLSRVWPLRRRALGSVSQRLLDAPIMQIPEQMDWSYFQAAPPDQRVDYLRGDEWVHLEGMHPKHTVLRSQLPSARGLARVHGPFEGSPWRSMQLDADTLHIDADALVCTLVARGSFPVANEATLSSLWILAGMETAWGGVDWDAEPESMDASDLMEIVDEETGAPLTSKPSLSRTMEVPALGPMDRPIVPFREGAPAVPAASPAAPKRRPVGGDTVEIAPQTTGPHTLPFARPRRSVGETTLAAAPDAVAAPARPIAVAVTAPSPPAVVHVTTAETGSATPLGAEPAPRAAPGIEPSNAEHWRPVRIETAQEEAVVLRPPPPKKKEPPPIDRLLYGKFGRRA